MSDPSGFRRAALRPYVVLAAVAVAFRLIAALVPGRLTALSAGVAGLEAFDAAAQALVLGLFVARSERAGRVSRFLVAGVLMMVLAQIAGSVVSTANAIGIGGTVMSGSATYTFELVAYSAASITGVVGAALVPIGLLLTFRGTTPPQVGVAVVALAVGLWLALAAVVATQILAPRPSLPSVAIATIVVTGVGSLAWVGTALVTLDRRSEDPRSLGPLAIGAFLIAVAGMAGTTIAQIAAVDPPRFRDTPYVGLLVLTAVLVAVGWLLVLLAAWRRVTPDRTAPQRTRTRRA